MMNRLPTVLISSLNDQEMVKKHCRENILHHSTGLHRNLKHRGKAQSPIPSLVYHANGWPTT